jgi:hypothetical protein
MYNWYATHGLESIGYERTAFTEGMKAYLDTEARRRNKFLPLVELSHRQTNKQTRIQLSRRGSSSRLSPAITARRYSTSLSRA